jgi:hypothetical protein
MNIMQSIKNLLSISLVSLLMAFSVSSLVVTGNAYALDCPDTLPSNQKSECEICRGAGGTEYTNGKCTTGNGGDPETQVSKLVADIINIFSWVVGIAAVIMIMVGGFKYITSTGDSGNVTSAKNTILYAIIGLVIVALAQIIVRFVLNKV